MASLTIERSKAEAGFIRRRDSGERVRFSRNEISNIAWSPRIMDFSPKIYYAK